MATIKDVKMSWTEDDIEKVQLKPNLYVRKYGPAGCNHLAAEIIQNAYDECNDKHSPGNQVTIKYDKSIDQLTVSDNGRGFPEKDYSLDIFCTKIQSGSKSTREQSGGTSGEFGVGATVVNALSTHFMITNHRKQEKTSHKIRFKSGKKVDDVTDVNSKGSHGSVVEFIPNKKYLGKDARIDIDGLVKWVKSLTYLFGSNAKKITTVIEIVDGTKKVSKEKIDQKRFSELLFILEDKLAMLPVDISASTTIEEVSLSGDKITKDLLLEVSFGYKEDTNPDEITVFDSYCNFTNTTDGGVHVQTVDECICRYLQSETKNSLSEKEKEKIDILWSDVRTDLRCVINLLSSAQVQFVGNAKTQIGNKLLVQPIKTILLEELKRFFNSNKNLLEQYTKLIKRNAKARIDLQKNKSVTIRTKTNAMLDLVDASFTPCNNNGKAYKEIYLVEGQRSAMGGLVDARNADTQAVLGFRGVTVNAFKRDENNIYDNIEMKNYCEKIGFDIRTQDVSKVRYNKIIISTDADIDGEYIYAGLCGFHARFARPIIDAGLLYRVLPPLYSIDDKETPFIRSKKEMSEVITKNIIKHFKVTNIMYGKFTKAQLREFIEDTSSYVHDITLIAEHCCVNSRLIEIVAYNLTMYATRLNIDLSEYSIKKIFNDSKFIKALMNQIQVSFPEVTLDGNILTGVIDGNFQALGIDRNLIDYITNANLQNIYEKYDFVVDFEENKTLYKKYSLLEFLTHTLKYTPKIIERFKGLAEANWEDLAKMVMNPSTRLLVQLSFDDLERDMKLIELLQANTVEARKYRKDLMKHCKIRREDIDN